MSEVIRKELPTDWEWTKLGNVVSKIIGGGTPSKENPEYWDGDIPWMTVKDMRTQRPADAIDHISEKAVAESSTNIIPEDTVIIATRIGLGKVIRVPYRAAINQDLKAIIVSPELDKSYLEYWFVSQSQYLASIGSGTTVKGIRLEQLRDLDFPLAPLDQQKRIVAKIEELFSHIDAGVEGLKKTQRLLKQYRQSVLKAAVTGELTKEWREENKSKLELAENFLKRIIKEKIEKKQGKNKKSEMIDVANLATLPDEWCWAKTDQMGFIQLGRQRAPKYHNGANMKPYLRVQNVFEDRIDLDDVMEMDFLPSDYEKYQLKYNDILLNEGQSPELLGRPAIYRGELPNGCFTNTLIRFQVGSGLLPEYALLVFRHFMHSGRFKKAGTITTNIGHLSAGRFSEIEFPLCSTLEQEEIVRITDDKLLRIKRLEDDVDRLLRRADRNKQSILKHVFMGNYPDVQN